MFDTKKTLLSFYCFTFIVMPHNMIILYFRLPHFHVSNSASFSTWYPSTLILHRRNLDTFYGINHKYLISMRLYVENSRSFNHPIISLELLSMLLCHMSFVFQFHKQRLGVGVCGLGTGNKHIVSRSQKHTCNRGSMNYIWEVAPI